MAKKPKIIAVGGMIGAGKSSLVKNLSGLKNTEIVEEIDKNDELTKLMLGYHQGSKSPTATTKFQIHFLTTCFLNHRNRLFRVSPKTDLVCLDRTILEHTLFAKHYKSIDIDVYNCMWRPSWERYVNLLDEYDQLPDMYYILDAKVSVLFERLIVRNRKEEMENYQQMISSFVRLATLYVPKMIETLNKFNVRYKIIETNNLSEEEVFSIVQKDIKDNIIEKRNGGNYERR